MRLILAVFCLIAWSSISLANFSGKFSGIGTVQISDWHGANSKFDCNRMTLELSQSSSELKIIKLNYECGSSTLSQDNFLSLGIVGNKLTVFGQEAGSIDQNSAVIHFIFPNGIDFNWSIKQNPDNSIEYFFSSKVPSTNVNPYVQYVEEKGKWKQ